MKNEKILERVYQIINILSPEDKAMADKFMRDEYGRYGDLCIVPALLTDLLKDVREEMLAEELKASGKSGIKKAADKIIAQLGDDKRAGAFQQDGLQYFGGNYSAVRTSDELPLRKLQEGVEPIDYKRCIDNASQNAGAVLKLPSVAELSVYIKTGKAENKGKPNFKAKWDFGVGLPQVDAQRLLEVLQIMGECTATASAVSPLTHAIYFKNDSAEAILLPMRK